MWTYSYIMKDHESDDNKIKFNSTARDIDGSNNAAIAAEAGDLAKEKYFTKYWHLLPSDMYDPCNIMEQVYNHTQDTSIGIHGPKLKDAATGLSGLAGTLSSNATTLESALGSSTDQAAQAAQGLVTELKNAASKSSAITDDEKGLKELLGDLSKATGFFDLVAKVKLVLAKFKDVEAKYNNVEADPKAKQQPKFTEGVKPKFTSLQTEFNKIKRLDKFHLVTVPSI